MKKLKTAYQVAALYLLVAPTMLLYCTALYLVGGKEFIRRGLYS